MFQDNNQFLSFFLSVAILLHIILFGSFLLIWKQNNTLEKKPVFNQAAYVYQKSASKNVLSQTNQSANSIASNKKMVKAISHEKNISIKHPYQAQTQKKSVKNINSENSGRSQNPIHLIGENKIVKPLVKLLAQALSAHLVYPKIAIDFNMKGAVLIGFNLNPNGEITNVKIVKSSQIEILDQSALDAVKAASPIYNVNQYLKEVKYLVVGILYR